MKTFVSIVGALALFFVGPSARGQGPGCTDQALSLAQQQLTKTMNYINTSQFPLATDPRNSNRWNAGVASDWTSGFFPGWIWYVYEQTLDASLLTRAQSQTAKLVGEATDASGHDIGFRILSSYGNGYRITRDPAYMSVIQTAAQTLATLYRPGAGVIESWPNYDSQITVIIDNMMNLELLFFASQNGGDPNWYNMAVSHALKTMQNNVRPDGSTFQGVDYNADGSVNSKFTADGASATSTWSRGQSWGLYGFTMSYRYTQDPRFLATAQQLADYFIANLPPDLVPYWDFSKSSPEPRDSSAAAIAAAGLLELSTYVPEPAKSSYYNAAINIHTSLSSSYYLGNPLNTDGILLHGTYSKPYSVGIDTSLIWGDYFFIQGCHHARTLPSAPFNLTAAASSSQVALRWDAQQGAIRYSLKRSTTAGGPYTILAPPPILTSSSFNDQVTPSTTYYYVVSSTNIAGESPNSAEVVVTTPSAKLSTVTILTSSLNPSTAGQSVTLRASVSPAVATGSAQFFVDGTAGPFVNLTGGAASYSTSALIVGSHSITAIYGGDSSYNGSTSSPLVQTVLGAPAADFSISASPAIRSVNRGASTTFTINVAPANGFTANVTLSVSGLPQHIDTAFNPNPISSGSGSATLTISTNRNAPKGTRTLNVTGVSGGISHVVQLTLTIN